MGSGASRMRTATRDALIVTIVFVTCARTVMPGASRERITSPARIDSIARGPLGVATKVLAAKHEPESPRAGTTCATAMSAMTATNKMAST